MKSKNALLTAGILISLTGLFFLYIVYANSSIPFTDANLIDESMIGQSVKSKVEVSSVKNYNFSTIIYPKKHNFKILLFVDIELKENSILDFSGRVDEDKYGLVIFADKLTVRDK